MTARYTNDFPVCMLLVQIQEATCTCMIRSVTDGYLGGHSDRATPGSRPIEHERSGSKILVCALEERARGQTCLAPSPSQKYRCIACPRLASNSLLMLISHQSQSRFACWNGMNNRPATIIFSSFSFFLFTAKATCSDDVRVVSHHIDLFDRENSEVGKGS